MRTSRPCRSAPSPARRWLAPLACASVLPTLGAQAQTPPPPQETSPAAVRAPATDAAQRVEINGVKGNDAALDERRRATASKIVIGREELDRMGDSSLGDVLKRLPGVTMGGPPGRGSGPSMRGMGTGYTQVLINGERMPPGFSLDSIPPEQIERIEVMRAPVAEFSTRAIAGTINVVMRGEFKRKVNELRVGGGVEGERLQGNANWQRNGQTDSLGWSASLAINGGRQDNQANTRTEGGLDSEGGAVDLEDSSTRTRGTRVGVFGNGRVQFKLDGGQSLELTPFLHLNRSQSEGTTERTVTSNSSSGSTANPAYTHADVDNHGSTSMARLNGSWTTSTASGGKLQVQLSTMLAESESTAERQERGGTAASSPGGVRLRNDETHSRDLGVETKGKFSQLLGDSHSMSTGWELQRNTRSDWQRRRIDGVIQTTPFGENVDATIQRSALYAQDEWEWSKRLSFYAGARWEGIATTGETDVGTSRNRSSVLTPLAHLVWKLDDQSRDLLRSSLTRSYRSPSTNQLVGRLNPTTQFDLNVANDALSPDRIGNPELKPELAWNLDLAFEHYLENSGVLSASAYYKRIDGLIRTLTSGPQTVSWSSAPRYVSKPMNVGSADVAGLELEAKGRLSDWISTELPLTLRANAAVMWSRVSGVPGPDNRIDEQAPWTLNLGGDLPVQGTPLTVGWNWGYTPQVQVRQSQAQSVTRSAKSALDFYGMWRVGPETNVRLSVNNALAQDYDTGTTVYGSNGDVDQHSLTRTRTYAQVTLRAELKF
ncbi:TonB-dependent receptor plug domain-containing protein [Ideonella sp.]|uniref:TonB-dependent receptor plug domain-containing protein n=1 Tax=Ideonella sp. TaxID=1929293 RepID=UPI003BB6EE2A